MIQDGDMYATDLMKCFAAIKELERKSPEEREVSANLLGLFVVHSLAVLCYHPGRTIWTARPNCAYNVLLT